MTVKIPAVARECPEGAPALKPYAGSTGSAVNPDFLALAVRARHVVTALRGHRAEWRS
jgi:hypothetical protein